MREVRGFVHFENRTFDETKNAFLGFNLDSVRLAFFKELYRYDHSVLEPGVFITGQVNDRYLSKDIVTLLRKQISLEETIKNCDVSVGYEDTLKSLKEGVLTGNYVGIRIHPPYSLNKIYSSASKFGQLVNAHDILVRTVESEKNKPLVCIDFITKESFDNYKTEVEKRFSSEGLKLGKYTFILLE